jgi:hypothetical protein
VQLRFASGLTGEDYVKHQGWLRAVLPACPLHPAGGCGFARHSSYKRAKPPGARVARYYCPKGHRTFSLLPDCLASRLPSTLEEVERVATEVEESKDSLEAVAQRLRPLVELQGAARWVRRREKAVRVTLITVVGLLPSLLAGCPPRLDAFRKALGEEQVLLGLRERVARHLSSLPPPLGFGPRPAPRKSKTKLLQHGMGPDPPDKTA